MLIVNINTLQTVYSLNLSGEIIGNSGETCLVRNLALNGEKILRID